MAAGSFVLSIALFVILFANGARSNEITSADYVHIIKAIHTMYKTSSVFYMQSGTFEDLQLTTLMHYWSREFSRNGVLSVVVTFGDILKSTQIYNGRIVRPLYVVAINRNETLAEFMRICKSVHSVISYPVWLIIFLKYNEEKPFEKLCLKPRENIFGVKFNTEMLVICYERAILGEWYAISDNITRSADLAVWEAHNKSLTILDKQGLYSRRDDMFNETLRIASLTVSRFVWVQKNKTLNGLLGTIFNELSRTLNFSMEILESRDTYGSWNPELNEWTGVMNEVVTQAADVGVSDFTMTSRRMTVVDYTIPLINTRSGLYIREPDGEGVPWSGYFQVFDSKVWAAMTFMIITVPLVLTFMNINIERSQAQVNPNVITVMLECYTSIFGISCQQGLPNFPSPDALRIAYYTMFLSALIILGAYSASLISFLTVSVPNLPFSSIEGFIKDGTYKLIVFKASANYDMFVESRDPLIMSMARLMKNNQELPLTSDEGFKQVCEEKVAFYTTESIRREMRDLGCKVIYIPSGRIDNLGMILSRSNPYSGLINYHLQRFQDNGMLSRMRGSLPDHEINTDFRHPSVEISGVAPLLIILSGGVILGVIIVGLENLYFYRSKRIARHLARKHKHKQMGKVIQFEKPRKVPEIVYKHHCKRIKY